MKRVYYCLVLQTKSVGERLIPLKDGANEIGRYHLWRLLGAVGESDKKLSRKQLGLKF
jgi:hypothetical protein